MRWRLVSERQLDNELPIAPSTSSLRAPFMAETVSVEKFLELGLRVEKEEMEEIEGLGFGSLGMRVLGGFKVWVY